MSSFDRIGWFSFSYPFVCGMIGMDRLESMLLPDEPVDRVCLV